ncbi:hypothetical protein [Clostridium butyricum]|uniref:hypothetical protein n=1 Tax=Clostridium butyricum TaxID=1492 RepID=UPI0013FAC92F|nr:hypothetical protein [Clostridium butyricum]MCQ2017284.1 hypothetical protein [Clostridium butyricum]MCQ2021157.1 hypothetical protein [Clostridium butyricum]NFB72513.1 hypothetical protein [Clostridium butyricum]NFB91562.1 hypothetical protein [Clostridium butyricum]
MNNAILQARKAHRKALESTYEHFCTIKEYKSVKDEITKVTSKKDVIVVENQPCKLSYKNITSADKNEANSTISQSIKLFIAPEIEILEGSKIVVNHNGRTTEFKNSGKPAVYYSHQEIILELIGNA